MDLITIITPYFRKKKYVKKSIQSILNQTYTNFELIIVDDGSTDGTDKLILQFAKKDSRIKPYFFKTNSGKDAVPKNFAIQKARGEYICFLDSDDLWHKDKLQIQNQHLKKNTILVCTACRYINEEGLNHTSLFMHYFRKFLQLFSNGSPV